jgi:hypothetical protein
LFESSPSNAGANRFFAQIASKTAGKNLSGGFMREIFTRGA